MGRREQNEDKTEKNFKESANKEPDNSNGRVSPIPDSVQSSELTPVQNHRGNKRIFFATEEKLKQVIEFIVEEEEMGEKHAPPIKSFTLKTVDEEIKKRIKVVAKSLAIQIYEKKDVLENKVNQEKAEKIYEATLLENTQIYDDLARLYKSKEKELIFKNFYQDFFLEALGERASDIAYEILSELLSESSEEERSTITEKAWSAIKHITNFDDEDVNKIFKKVLEKKTNDIAYEILSELSSESSEEERSTIIERTLSAIKLITGYEDKKAVDCFQTVLIKKANKKIPEIQGEINLKLRGDLKPMRQELMQPFCKAGRIICFYGFFLSEKVSAGFENKSIDYCSFSVTPLKIEAKEDGSLDYIPGKSVKFEKVKKEHFEKICRLFGKYNSISEAEVQSKLILEAFENCRINIFSTNQDQAEKLLEKKVREFKTRLKYNIVSKDDKKTAKERHLAYLNWQKARVEYRIALYDVRTKNDPGDMTAHKKQVIAKNLRAHIDQMRLACDASLTDVSSATYSDQFPKSRFSKNGELGAIRKDLVKRVFKKDRMNDLKYCKSPADTKKLFEALLKLRDAEYQFDLDKSDKNKLAKIQCDLEYRKTFYEIRCQDKNKSNQPKDKKAAAKLVAVNDMLGFVSLAHQEVTQPKTGVIQATLTTASESKQGKLGKLRDELKAFRDTYQEKNLADKQAAFKTAKEDYKKTSTQNANQKLIAKLTMLKAELELKETLYAGRAKTSSAFYHGFFSKSPQYKSPDKKHQAATELKGMVSDLLEKIEEQNRNEGAFSISDDLLGKFSDVPGQDTLNRIRHEIKAELKGLIASLPDRSLKP